MAQDKKNGLKKLHKELVHLKEKIKVYKKIYFDDDQKIDSAEQQVLDNILISINKVESKIEQIKQKNALSKIDDNLVSVMDKPVQCETDYDKDIMTPGKWNSMDSDFKTHLRAWLSEASIAIEQVERRVQSGAKEEDDGDIGLALVLTLMGGLGPLFSNLKIITKLGTQIGKAAAEAVSVIAHEISKNIYDKAYKEIKSSSSSGKVSIEDFTDAWATTYSDFVGQSDVYFNQLKEKLTVGCDIITEGVVDQAIKDIVRSLPNTKALTKKITLLWIKASADDSFDNGDHTAAEAGHIIIKIQLEEDDGVPSFSLFEDPFIDDVPPGTTKAVIKAFGNKSLLDKALQDIDLQVEFFISNIFTTIPIGHCTREKQKWGKYSNSKIKTLMSKHKQTIARTARVKDLVPD
jgi:hypothetical protein